MAWYWYTCVSAALLFSAFIAPAYTHLLAFLGIAFFAVPLDRFIQKKHALAHSVCVGMVSASGAIFWFWHTIPLTWLGVSSVTQAALLAGVTWVIVSAALGGGFVLLGALFVQYKTRSWFDVPFFGALWVASEFVGMWLFALVLAGPHIPLEPHYSFGFIGYIFSDYAVTAPLVSWGGVYVLSASAACLGFIIARTWSSFWYTGAAILIVVSVLFNNVPLHKSTIDSFEQMHEFALVTTAIPAQEKVDVRSVEYKRVFELIDEAAKSDPDTILLPEDIRVFQQIEAFFATREFIPVVGSTRTISEPLQERVWEYTQDGAYLTRAKYLLLPYGEYMPYLGSLVVRMIAGEQAVRSITQSRAQVPADRDDTRGMLGAYARFCSEILSPALFVEDAQRGVPFLLHLANFSWFHGSSLLERRMISMARVRAMESGRWFISVNNMSASYVLDERGALVARLPSEGVLSASVPHLASRTVYQVVHQYVPYMFFMYTLVHITLLLYIRARYTEVTYGRKPSSVA